MTEGASEGFADYIAQRNLAGARLGSTIAATLVPAFAALDWLTHPSLAPAFMVLRAVASVAAIGLVLLTYLPSAKRHVFTLGVAPAIVCAAVIEIMVEELEGYSSPYYVGLCLCIMATGVIYTWKLHQAALACCAILGIWLFPSLVDSRPLAVGSFVNNLSFLVGFSLIAVASNVNRYRMAKTEYDARMQVVRTTAELAVTLEKLKETDRLKNEFFANISHELRTPLTLILPPVQEMIESGPQEIKNKLTVVKRNAERLLRLIDDLLDLAKLEVGGLRITVSPVDLRALATQIVEVCRPAAEAKSIALCLTAPKAPADVHGDAHRLEIVFTNLIGNALKFTPDGGRIDLRLYEESGMVVIDIADTGPGIPEIELSRIFERFYQVEGSERRRHGGVGIGLALAKQLTELHGGQLTVESEVGRGTTFKVRLPTGKAHFRPEIIERRRAAVDGAAERRIGDRKSGSTGPLPAIVEPSLPSNDSEPILLDGERRPRVLIAEDQEDLRAFIKDTLSPQFEVVEAVNGDDALAKVMTHRPDLVLSDVMMPGSSGTDLCRAMKGDENLRNIPIILLTARIGTEAALEGYGAGADDFVTKPFHTRVLIARVRSHLKVRALALQLAGQAKLAAVGTLAAGVAHEVRNPLNAILNAARVLTNGKIQSEDRLAKMLGIILDAGQRVEAIVAALDQHARPAETERAPFDVREGIDATLKLLEHRSTDVKVHKDYETNKMVLAPAGEINQVFMNILDNAVRAPASNIWITVSEEQGRVVVRIADDGPGVPPEVASRIFDPFFTTRAPGEGTGLGLYLSRRIIVKHGGDLRIERRPTRGAQFAIDLPAEAAS